MTYQQPWFWCWLWPHQPHSAGLSCSCQCPPALRCQSSGSSGHRMFQLGHDGLTQESPEDNRTEKTHARLGSKPKRWHLNEKAGDILGVFFRLLANPMKWTTSTIYSLFAIYSKCIVYSVLIHYNVVQKKKKNSPKYTVLLLEILSSTSNVYHPRLKILSNKLISVWEMLN